MLAYIFQQNWTKSSHLTKEKKTDNNDNNLILNKLSGTYRAIAPATSVIKLIIC